MYYAVAMNRQLAARNDPGANQFADKVKACFTRDSLLQEEYNRGVANGKWAHMMDQTRIGYFSWQQPPRNIMPRTTYISPEEAATNKIFMEQEGYVSIEAENYARLQNGKELRWEVIPHFGKTVSGITTFPQNRYPSSEEEIYLEYDIAFETTGVIELQLLLAPTRTLMTTKG